MTVFTKNRDRLLDGEIAYETETAKHRSAINGRTTWHAGYALSQRKRKRIEEIFGWLKTVGGLR